MSARNTEVVAGGCLCGGIRYRVTAPVAEVAHCHCRMCRRAVGAVVVTWFTVPLDAFEVTLGRLKTWQSSAKGERGFCPDCGTQITFYHADYPDDLDVTLASLDRPEDHPAEAHIWTGSRLPWLHLDEHLPQSSNTELPGDKNS